MPVSTDERATLLQRYLELDKQQTQHALELIEQHSNNPVPDVAPTEDAPEDWFDIVKTKQQFAFYIAHPDSVTPINEQLNSWSIIADTDLKAVKAELYSSEYRQEQKEVLRELGHDAELIGDAPFSILSEFSFIEDLKEELIPNSDIQLLKSLPIEQLKQVSSSIAEDIATINQIEVLIDETRAAHEDYNDLKTDQGRLEHQVKTKLAEQGLVASDFIPEATVLPQTSDQVFVDQDYLSTQLERFQMASSTQEREDAIGRIASYLGDRSPLGLERSNEILNGGAATESEIDQVISTAQGAIAQTMGAELTEIDEATKIESYATHIIEWSNGAAEGHGLSVYGGLNERGAVQDFFLEDSESGELLYSSEFPSGLNGDRLQALEALHSELAQEQLAAQRFDRRLETGDLSGALDESIKYAEESKQFAQDAIASLQAQNEQSHAIAQAALEKYPTLENQTRVNPMELDGKDPLTEHKDQLESTNEVDRSPQLLDERSMTQKEFAVIQSVMDSFAISNPQELAEIMATENLELDEARSLFLGLGLEVDEYGRDEVLEEEEAEL